MKWQDWVDTSSQLEAVGNLAAHVHITTIELLNRSHYGNICDLVSPKTFIECLMMTQKLAIAMKQKEKVMYHVHAYVHVKKEGVGHPSKRQNVQCIYIAFNKFPMAG